MKDDLFQAVKVFCARQGEASPKKVAAKFGLTQKQATDLCHRVREAGGRIDCHLVPASRKFQSEMDFENFIIGKLVRNGFVERKFRKNDDPNWRREYAMDTGLLMSFLEDSQPETMARLKKVFKAKYRETITAYINKEIMKKGGGLLSVLKHGVEIANEDVQLLYRKPEHPKVVEQARLYAKNVFSVAKEVWASDKERIDLVVFVNGLAIMSFELKCNTSNQGYVDAVNQYKTKRDPKTRLFNSPGGCLVNFAMDLDQVYMATRLEGKNTSFLPFNRGCGVGVDAGAGNSPVPGKYAVHYMWDEVLTRDRIVELVMKYMFVDREGKTVFPRYHQLDCVSKLLESVRELGTTQNYLIEHSAGSGKTNSIAWLAHRLASLHNEDGEAVDDNVIIVTDRVVVDRQLQSAIKGIEHKDGLIKVLDDDSTSADLAKAINGNTKIIATTIQKFPYIVDAVDSMKDKHFAVIIDEAHSSTSGKDMIAVTKVLGLGADIPEDADTDDIVRAILRKHGKQKNVAMFAFTATPKPETLQLFGTLDENGHKAPFHVYSMKQAIEEGFILDVLQSFVGYRTHFEIVKKIEDDPMFKEKKAKSKIVRFAMLHDLNVRDRTEIICDHFHGKVKGLLDDGAKAMVVCGSRREAYKYRMEIEKYLRERGWWGECKALVAFSGSLKVDGKDRTEASVNGFGEKKLPDEFKKRENRILVVANKYQTGFDQPNLCAMYVLKGLSGIAAVQTLSRLNRICKPYDKKTFILDFANTSEEIEKAFRPYYTTTILGDTVSPQKLYAKLVEIMGYGIVDLDDVESVWKLLARRQTPETRQAITAYLDQAKVRYGKKLDVFEQQEFRGVLGSFCKWYEFIIQASHLEDVDLYKKYRFFDLLKVHLNDGIVVEVMDLRGKIDAKDFVQEKVEDIDRAKITPKPIVNISDGGKKGKEEDLETRLSRIIEDINNRFGLNVPQVPAIKSIEQIQAAMLASKKLGRAAKANTFAAFKIPYMAVGEEAIIESYEQNQGFFNLLLKNKDIAEQILSAIAKGVYEKLKGEK